LTNEVCFYGTFLGGLSFLAKNDQQKLKRINELFKDIARSPYESVGKAEALRFNYTGFWSRRIDEEHRLIYRVVEDEIQIAKCRFHYD
jgi:toxin YoeB